MIDKRITIHTPAKVVNHTPLFFNGAQWQIMKHRSCKARCFLIRSQTVDTQADAWATKSQRLAKMHHVGFNTHLETPYFSSGNHTSSDRWRVYSSFDPNRSPCCGTGPERANGLKQQNTIMMLMLQEWLTSPPSEKASQKLWRMWALVLLGLPNVLKVWP